MSQAALAFGTTFETVPLAVEKGRTMTPAVLLESATALREVPVFPGPASFGGRGLANRVRAFRVQGDELGSEGFFDGDYILVGCDQRARSAALVLAEVDGRHVLRRARPLGRNALDRAIPSGRILGTFLGVIRKRGFGEVRMSKGVPARLLPIANVGAAAPSKVTMLRGRLGMLESTCAETHNPRLQRALRNEAERVRRQLQNEAPFN
jgi:hypothetical protein